jgi:D-cysteine desulfhydrase
MTADPTATPPRYPLGFWPTPLQRLQRLGDELGIELWIKRDDLSGLAAGGNKVRKLEYLIGAALAAGADCVITGGAAQSNHSRQTAGAAAAAGLGCHLALGGEAPETIEGNLLLDRILGAELHWCGADRKGERIPSIVEELRGRGLSPYLIPYGGSDATGAMGFVRAAAELHEQALDRKLAFSEIVFPSSSGGTHAGLIEGARRCGLEGRLVGMHIDPADPRTLRGKLLDLCAEIAGSDHAPEIHLDEISLYGEYEEFTNHEIDAIRRLARTEGILLDPVYTGRAFAGLLQRIEEGVMRGPVLFWHTGGLPALFTDEASKLTG